MNFKPTRIGLLNFWLYDDEEFYFADGKLLLRGENGSGKSVTMQSFIPLILDGNKSPKRLDPFGSTDKHIEAYLLGGYDTEQKDEATGYLYMEFYDEKALKYVTIGMGLHAKKGRPVDFWGFGINDGRRVNRDIFLYKNRMQKVPLSKNELKNNLGVTNIFVDTTKEYKKMVNNMLFGFQNIEDYDEFINVLIQLRSPKLSKEYKPTVLMSILSKVMEPLSDDDLRPLSDAVEEMDNTKEKIDQLKKHLKQLSYLMQSYRNYNEAILYRKAVNYDVSTRALKSAKDNLVQTEEAINDSKDSLLEIERKLTTLDVEFGAAKKSLSEIDSRDLESKVEKLQELNNSIDDLGREIDTLHVKQNDFEDKRVAALDKQKNEKENKDYYEKNIAKIIELICSLCDKLKFNEPVVLLKDFKKDFESEIDFASMIQRTRSYGNSLSLVLTKLREKAQQETSLGEKESILAKLNREQKDLIDSLEKYQGLLDECLLAMRDKILLLAKTNKFVKINDDDKNRLIEPCLSFSLESYEETKAFYERIADAYYKDTNREYYRIDGKIKEINKNLEIEKGILEELKSKKEEEIAVDSEESETFVFLNEQSIKYIPFYKAVDFKDGLSLEIKNRLESTLLKSGVLNSLIIDSRDLSKVKNHKGTFVVKGAKKKVNLTKFLDVASNVDFDKSVIIGVLESISALDNDMVSFSDGSYKIDNIYGYGSGVEVQKYIGILAREEAQRSKIKEKESEINVLESQLANLRDMLIKKSDELDEIEHEKTLFPSAVDVENVLKEQDKIDVKIEMNKENVLEISNQIKAINESLGSLYREINDYKDTIKLPLNMEEIQEANYSVDSLIDLINDLKSDYNLFRQVKDSLVLINDRVEEIEESIAEVYFKIKESKKSIQELSVMKDNIEKILNSPESKKLSDMIRSLKDKIERIPIEREELKERQGGLRISLNNLEEQFRNDQETIAFKEKECQVYQNIFRSEYDLHYVMNEEKSDSDLITVILQNLKSKKDANIGDLVSNFMENYNKYRNELSEYKLSYAKIFEDEVSDEHLKDVYGSATRYDYSAIYQGHRVDLFVLEKALSDSIVENELIISEQDRNLFEEILLKTVGSKIREHIDESKKWVKTINQIMKDMQSLSALSFQLEWKPKDKEAIDEIDTRELISLFNISADMIKQTDSDKLIKHFRSKLKNKIDDETHESYSDIIFDILDYRTWFEFKMFYTRTGENRRELTDKVFSIFSGGEKAKTMYLPLFTAVCAKLQGARANAPRLVALDEAFAGVDDINIREMFGIMDSLNLDYILTSQALWGDYDTIKEIGIAELLRPNNSSTVGVRRYHWNGFVKEVVQKREIDDGTLELF